MTIVPCRTTPETNGKRDDNESDQGSRAEPRLPGRQSTKLDDRYGKIGISAVAAALRHQGELRNPREAHASTLDTAAG